MEALGDGAILHWFMSMAYQPWNVYLACVALLIASSFGLPLPEEVTLLSAGFMAYIGRSPDQFPPPTPGAPVVDAWVLAVVCTVAVFTSDLLVYGIGRRFCRTIRQSWLGRRLVSPKSWTRAEAWVERHGVKVCWVFRFMPGIRFPGHLTCGLVRVPLWQFCVADGIATLISVPTQVLLIAHYGDVVLHALREFKLAIAAVLVLAIIVYVARKLWRRDSTPPDRAAPAPDLEPAGGAKGSGTLPPS